MRWYSVEQFAPKFSTFKDANVNSLFLFFFKYKSSVALWQQFLLFQNLTKLTVNVANTKKTIYRTVVASTAVQKSAVTRDVAVTSGGETHNLLLRCRMSRQNPTTVVHVPNSGAKRNTAFTNPKRQFIYNSAIDSWPSITNDPVKTCWPFAAWS